MIRASVLLILLALLCGFLTQAPGWVAIATLSVVFYSMVILTDAILFAKKIYSTALEPMLVTAVVQGVPLVGLCLWPIDATSKTALVYAFVAGVVNMLGNLCYFKAMDAEEDAKMDPVFTAIFINVIIAVVPVFAYFFVGETLGASQHVGIFLIFCGAIVASFGKVKTNPKIVFLMIGAVVTLSMSMVAMKGAFDLLAQTGSKEVYWTGYTLRNFGCLAFASVVALHLCRKADDRTHFFGLIKNYWYVLFITEGLQVGGDRFSLLATSLGDVSVVTALDGLMPIFILVATITIGFFANRFGREEAKEFAVNMFEEQTAYFLSRLLGMFAIMVGAYLAT